MRLKIDGMEVDAPPGTTVKDAAFRAGVKIPGLCDHPNLEPYGGCRLCLVEIDGMRGYPSSCTMPVSEGMVVRTDTSALRKLRRGIFEMLLSEHPAICLFCERAGRCDSIREPMRKAPQSMGCRYCPQDQRCELQAVAEQISLERIELPHLGGRKEVVRSPFFDRDPNLCILCGRCIRACQDRGLGVISFTSRGFESGIGTAFDRPLEESGCRFCGACVDVCPTGALAERGSKWAGISEETVETTCPFCSSNCQIGLEVSKGKFLRSRALKSKLCVRGRFGLEFINSRIRLQKPLMRKSGKLVETSWDEALNYAAKGLSGYSGDEFVFFASGILSNEALYVAWKLASQVMKSEAVAPDVATLDSCEEHLKNTLIIIGDLAETNPATELSLRSKGAVVVSPYRTLLASQASQWLCPQPGREHLLLNCLAEAMKGRVKTAGSVSSDEISQAAIKLKGASVIVGPSCSADVKVAAGNLAKAAEGRLCLLGQSCNSRGASALGLFLGYDKAERALSSGAIKAAYMAGFNPAKAHPEIADALSRLDFLVVQDLFLNETARLAHVVFPAASFAEVDGTFLGSGQKILPLRQAASPLGRPDWQILSEVGRRMGGLGFEFSDSKMVLDEMLAQRRSTPIYNFRGSSPPKEAPKDAYLLVQGPSLFQFGSHTRTSKVSDLQYLTREQRMEINPEDAKKIGIKRGDSIAADCEDGRILARAVISRQMPPGVLRMAGLKCSVLEARVRRDV